MFIVPEPHPQEFHDEVVRVVRNREPGGHLEQVAADVGVRPSLPGSRVLDRYPWSETGQNLRATTARARDVETVRALGADEVVDFTAQDFTEVLSGYDVVLDSLGPASVERSMTVLRPGGLVISVVGPPDPSFAAQLGRPLLAPVMALLSRKVRRRAKKLGARYAFFFMRADGARLAALSSLYDDGTLRPVLDRTFDFEQTPEALAYVEQGKARGKVVVTR